MQQSNRPSKKRRALRNALLIALLPLTMGQIEDCLEDPPPQMNAKPLAVDCVAGGTQVYIPLEMTVAPDRPIVALAGGAFVDTTVTARVPAEMFCAVASNATTADIQSATLTIGFSNVREQGASEAVHNAVNLPMPGIDLDAACAGSLGPDILIDFGTTQTVPWADEGWHLDFEILPPPSLQIMLANVDVGGGPGVTVDLFSYCDPTDKSDPPNGTTYDPEDSPRLVADRNVDGVYESVATASDQVRFNVQGYCAGYRCEDNNPCTVDLCNRLANGWCTWENEPDGTACDPGGGLPGVCNAGTCELYTGPPCDLSTSECTKTLTVACTNNVTSDVSFLGLDLTITPDAMVGGSTVPVSYDGVMEFPEFYLDALQGPPGGANANMFVAIQSTVHVRSGATATSVSLTNEPISWICSFDESTPCDPANDLPSIPGARGNTDCVPTGNFNACGMFVPIPMSTDCSPGGTCESLGSSKSNQCLANGFCVTGPIRIDLEQVDTSVVTDASGTVLFGWDDAGTGATVNPDGTWDLPPSIYADAVGSNGIRAATNGLLVGLDCTMGVDAAGPLGVLPPVPDQASPTPDSELVSFPIINP